MDRPGIRRAAWVLALVLIPGCAAPTSSEQAGIDQEIARNILWRYHSDIRFSQIRVVCEDRVITIEGRVPDPRSAADALQIALSESRGGKVSNKLEVRAR